MSDSLPVPQWEQILQCKAASRGGETQSQAELEAEKTMYICFLVHVYLEMHRGDLALKVTVIGSVFV